MNILLINAILYIVFLVFLLKIEGISTVVRLLWGMYTLIAFMGWYTVFDGTYFEQFGTYNLSWLVIEPYIFCFIAFAILLYPLKNLQPDIMEIDDYQSNESIDRFVQIWIVIYSVYSLLSLLEASITVTTGLADAYEARHYDGATFSYNNIIIDKFRGYAGFFLPATTPFIMTYSIMESNKGEISKLKALFLMTLCFLPLFCKSISVGSRGGLFMQFFCFLFFILLFKDYFDSKFKKILVVVISCVLSTLLFYSILISIDRIGDTNETIHGLKRYFGESFPNLGWKFWDQVSVHPMGKRLFADLTDGPEFAASGESFDYWEGITGVRILLFKPIFADLYIEFGSVGAFLFLILLSLFIKKVVMKDSINVLTLNYLYFYYQLCVFAFAGFTKGGHNTTFSIIIIIITNVIISHQLYGKIRLS